MHALLPLTQTSSPLPGALKLEQFERSQQQKSPRIFSSTVDTRHSVLKTLLRNVSLLATCCSISMAKGRDSSFDQCWRGLTGGTRSKAQKMKAELPYWICSQKQELEQVFIWSHHKLTQQLSCVGNPSCSKESFTHLPIKPCFPHLMAVSVAMLCSVNVE